MFVFVFSSFSVFGVVFTSGNVSFDGAYTVVTFLSNGTFSTTSLLSNVSVLVVAGGGAGGAVLAGGGGAGGLIYNNSINITNGTYTVIIGNGGQGSTTLNVPGANGTSSSFNGITATGGGGGGARYDSNSNGMSGQNGGSGGGASANSQSPGVIGTGIAGQGNNGGLGVNLAYAGGGGGGASTAGKDGVNNAQGGIPGNGGNGTNYSISGKNTFYAGGGAGGTCTSQCGAGANPQGIGGLGGGGNGSNYTNSNPNGSNGINGLGGGGGGGAYNGIGGNGGSGIVIIRYLSSLNNSFFYDRFCYQQFANGFSLIDGSCGLNFGGSYNESISGYGLSNLNAFNMSNITDGNKTSYTNITTLGTGFKAVFIKGNSYFNGNVTVNVPTWSSTGLVWNGFSYVAQSSGSLSIPLPLTCLQGSNVSLIVYNKGGTNINVDCLNNGSTMSGMVNDLSGYDVIFQSGTSFLGFSDLGLNWTANNFLVSGVSVNGSNLSNFSSLIMQSSVGLCYQESANVVNQNGLDGSCGLNYNGLYSTSNNFTITYFKPINIINNVIWQVKHGGVIENITLPNDCVFYSNNNINLKIQSDEVSSFSQPMCFNGSWKNIGTNTIGGVGIAGINNPSYLYDGDWGSASSYQSSTGIWHGLASTSSTSGSVVYEESVYWNVSYFNLSSDSNGFINYVFPFDSNLYNISVYKNNYLINFSNNFNVSNNLFINRSILNFTSPSSGNYGDDSIIILNLTKNYNQVFSNISLNYSGNIYSNPSKYDYGNYVLYSQVLDNNISVGNFNYTWNISLVDYGQIFNFVINSSQFIYGSNLTLNIFDENTGLVLNSFNVSGLLQNILNNKQYNFSNSLGQFNFTNISGGIYSLQLIPNNSGYGIRTYNVIINSSSNVFNAYLSGNLYVTLTYIDSSSGNALENVQVTMYRVINSSSTIVANHNTDVTGRVQFSYASNVLYNFVSSLQGYDNKNYVLNPILYSSYNVFLKKVSNFPSNLSDVNINILPYSFNCGENNTFVFQISSPTNTLSSYNYLLTYFNGSNVFSGNNPSGDADVEIVNITCDNLINQVVLSYNYSNIYGKNFSYVKTWVVGIGGVSSELASNYTITQNVLHRNSNNIGIMEQVLISTLITFLFLGVGSFLGGGAVGLLMGCVGGVFSIILFPTLAFFYSIVLLISFLLYLAWMKIGGLRG